MGGGFYKYFSKYLLFVTYFIVFIVLIKDLAKAKPF